MGHWKDFDGSFLDKFKMAKKDAMLSVTIIILSFLKVSQKVKLFDWLVFLLCGMIDPEHERASWPQDFSKFTLLFLQFFCVQT